MRELTHYELRVLIKNEVDNMYTNSREGGGISISDLRYLHERAKDILKYCEEYHSLPDYED